MASRSDLACDQMRATAIGDLWIQMAKETKRCADLMPSRRAKIHKLMDSLETAVANEIPSPDLDPILRLYGGAPGSVPVARYERILEAIPNRAQGDAVLEPCAPLPVVEKLISRERAGDAFAPWIFCQATRAHGMYKSEKVTLPSSDDLDRLRDIDLELEAFVVYSVLSSSFVGGMDCAHSPTDRLASFITRARSIFGREDGGDLAITPRDDAELQIALPLICSRVGEDRLANSDAIRERCSKNYSYRYLPDSLTVDLDIRPHELIAPGVSKELRAVCTRVIEETVDPDEARVVETHVLGHVALFLDQIDKWSDADRVALFEWLVERVPNRLTCGGINRPPSRTNLNAAQAKTVDECIARLLERSPLARVWMSAQTDGWSEWLPLRTTPDAPPAAMDVVAPPAESARPRAQDEVFGNPDVLARIVQNAVPIDATRPYSSMHEQHSVASSAAGRLGGEVSAELAKRVALKLVPESARGAVSGMSNEDARLFLKRAEAIGSLWGLAIAVRVADSTIRSNDVDAALFTLGVYVLAALRPDHDRDPLDSGASRGEVGDLPLDGIATAIVALPRALAIAEQSWGWRGAMPRFDQALTPRTADHIPPLKWSTQWSAALSAQAIKLSAAFPWTIPSFASVLIDDGLEALVPLLGASGGASLSIRGEAVRRTVIHSTYQLSRMLGDRGPDVHVLEWALVVRSEMLQRLAEVVKSRAFDPRLALDVFRIGNGNGIETERHLHDLLDPELELTRMLQNAALEKLSTDNLWIIKLVVDNLRAELRYYLHNH